MNTSIKVNAREWLLLLHDAKSEVEVDLTGIPFRQIHLSGWEKGTTNSTQHLLYLVIENSCSVEVHGRSFSMPVGALCWICPETKFRFHTGCDRSPPIVGRCRFVIRRAACTFRPDWSLRVLPDAWDGLGIIQGFAQEAANPGPFTSWRLKNLLSLLSIRMFGGDRSQEDGSAGLPEEVREKIHLIAGQDPSARLRPAELARRTGYSVDYFTRLFRHSYGISPKIWLVKQRLRSAAFMLHEPGVRIGEVAERLGYSNVQLFSRQFAKEYGISPLQWRRQNHAACAIEQAVGGKDQNQRG